MKTAREFCDAIKAEGHEFDYGTALRIAGQDIRNLRVLACTGCRTMWPVSLLDVVDAEPQCLFCYPFWSPL